MIQFLKTEDYTDFISFIKKNHSDIPIQILDEEETDPQSIIFEISNTSIFSEKRVIAIRNAKKTIPELKDFITDDNIYLHIKKDVKGIKSIPIIKDNIDNFIISLFQKENIKTNTQVINYLKNVFLDDRDTIKTEVDKIFSYIYPEKEIKDPQFIINNIITKKNTLLIWDLINAINKNDKKNIIQSYEILKAIDSDLRGIINMIIRQIEIIILVNNFKTETNKNISQKLKSKPFLLNITEYGVLKLKENKYNNDKLKELYHKLVHLYSLSNSGLIDMDLGILLILLRL